MYETTENRSGADSQYQANQTDVIGVISASEIVLDRLSQVMPWLKGKRAVPGSGKIMGVRGRCAQNLEIHLILG